MTLLKPPIQTNPDPADPQETGWRRYLRGRRGDLWLGVGMAALAVITVATLSGITGAMQAPSAPTANAPKPTATTAGGANVVAANERAYSLTSPNPGVMNPVVDQQGRIWFGEMASNKLAMLDPGTGKVTEWTPPNGDYNIMNEAVDAQGNVWFTEQAANYIGRFDPTAQTFKTYPVNTINGKGVGPEAIAIDAHGAIWFTEVTGGALGKMDPNTGQYTLYPLPNLPIGGPALPYALTIAPDGRVWYGNLTGGSVGVLDPATGKATQYKTPDSSAQVYTMTVGPDGAIYYTELQTTTFGRIDPATGKIDLIAVPANAGAVATLYSVTTHGDALWLTSTGANALIRYIPTTSQFTIYKLKTAQSVPYGLAFAPNGDLYFTAAGVPNYVGMVKP